MSAAAVHPQLSAQSPWPGLAAFAEGDRDFFRGRDREADELARLVRRERLSVLFGRSGLGKSSLLAAGLSPRLRDDRHLPVLLRIDYRAGIAPRAQVWQALMAEARRWQVSADAPHDDESLWAYFHRAGGGFWNARNRPVLPVLVLDQFEELFTLGQTDAAARAHSAAFVAELADLVEDRMPLALQQALESDPGAVERYDSERRGCKVVLSFREDFLAQVEGLRGTMPSVIRNRFRLLPMDREQAAAVVASGGELVAADVAPRILGLAWNNKAEPPPDDSRPLEFDPALLSVICAELNRLRLAAGEARIDLGRLESSGTGILSNFYDRTMAEVGPALRHFVEDELVTPTGVRDSRALDDALARPGVDAAEVMRLVDGRLLRMDERFGSQRLELTHDVLTGVVAERRRSRRAREAELEAQAREQRARLAQRRVRRTGAAVLVGALAAVALLVWAGYASIEAGHERANAQAAERKASDALAQARLAASAVERSAREAETLRQGSLEVQRQAQGIAQQAASAAAAASSAAARAAALLRDARAPDLVLNARLTSADRLDRALLLGAVAAQAYPDKLEGQIEQLARLLAVAHLDGLRRLDEEVGDQTVSADGRRMAVGTGAGEILTLDTARWQMVRRWQAGAREPVRALAFSPDGQLLASAQGNSVVVWRAADGAEMHRSDAARGDVSRIVFRADGRQLALRSHSGAVWLWTLPARDDPGRTRPLGGRFQTCMAFDGSARLLLSGPDGDAVWDGQQLQSRGQRTFKPGERVLATSPDCQLDVAGVEVKPTTPQGRSSWTLYLRRPFEGQRLGVLDSVSSVDDALSFRFAAAGRLLLQRERASLRVWSTAPLKSMKQFGLGDDQSALEASADGRLLASATRQRLTVFDVEQGTVRAELALHEMPTSMHFGADNATLVPFVRGSQSRVGLIPVLRLAPKPSQLVRDGEPHHADAVEFNRRGSALITVQRGSFNIWDVATGRFRHAFDDVVLSEFSPDGSLVALLSGSGRVVVVALDDPGRPRYTRMPEPAENGSLMKVALGSDNRLLVVLRADGGLELHDIQRKAEPRRLAGQAQARVIAISSDLQWVATGAGDGSLALHALSAARAASAPALAASHAGVVQRVAFSPDGRLLASGGYDDTVLVHAVPAGRLARRFEGLDVGSVDWLSFIEEGSVLVTGAERGIRHLWDLRTGLPLGRLGGEKGGAQIVDLSPRERRVAVLSADDSVALRRWDAATLVGDTCAMVARNLSCDEWRQYVPDLPYRRVCPAAAGPARCER